VDKGISPKPATLQEKASYYTDVAMKPFGDLFFTASDLVTGKKTEYTPSLLTRSIDAAITSSKYSLGLGEKDASGKPVDQSFGKTFEPIIEEYGKDPLKAIVQVPAEVGITIIGGKAAELGANAIRRGVLEPAARSAAKKEIETVLTKTFTGQEPSRTVTTTFGKQVVQKTAQIGEPIVQKTVQTGGKQAIQEIPTEVIIPVKRTVDAPSIVATPVKGRSDLFSIEGKLLEKSDKFVYATKNKNDINLIVSEAPLDLPPKKVTVLGSIEDVRPQAQVQLEKGLTQISDKPVFQTVDKPKEELLKILGTGIKDTQQLSVYGIKTVQENPKEFGRYLFGGESRTKLEEALLSKERPVSAKPLDETLVGVTESYGTRKSAVSTVKGTADKIKETGESVLIKRSGKTVISNPVKKNVENINQRIASEQRKLEKLDPTDPKNARDISIIENNIKRLQQRKLEISQKPDTIEILTTAPKAAIKTESSEQTRTFGNKVKGMFGIGEKVFKPFKDGAPTDLTVSRGRRGDFMKFIDPYAVVGKSKGVSKPPRPFTGKSSLLDNAEKGVAGGAGKAKSLLKTEKEKTNKIVNDLVKTSEPKVRADALGPITSPIYLKAYPAWETQGQSALEPQSMTAKRPVKSSTFTVPQPAQSSGATSELGSRILGNDVTPISKSGIFERSGTDSFLGIGEKGRLGAGILGGLGSKINPMVGEVTRTKIDTKNTGKLDDLSKLKIGTTTITDTITRQKQRTDTEQRQTHRTDLETKLTFDVPTRSPRSPNRPVEEFWRIPPSAKPSFGFGGGAGGLLGGRGGKKGYTQVYNLPAGLKGSSFFIAGDKRLFKQPRKKSPNSKFENPWF